MQLSLIGHGSGSNRKRRCESYSKTLRGSSLVRHAVVSSVLLSNNPTNSSKLQTAHYCLTMLLPTPVPGC